MKKDAVHIHSKSIFLYLFFTDWGTVRHLPKRWFFREDYEDSTDICSTEIPQLSIVVWGAAHLIIRDMDADYCPEFPGV
jgi:hypothetical protein